MFSSVLVANRGEIAVRIFRTLHALGIRSVAVHSDADADARHVRAADVALRIGPAVAAESYLDAGRIVDAAVASGAEAVHPGYGFLSEHAGLARAVAAAGLVWIGPPPAAMELMGDKIRAKQAVAAAGVPVVPGRSEPGLSDGDLISAAMEVGLPVLLKPSAGGGGKGMRRVDDPALLPEEIAAARREAQGAFGDGTLLVERWVARPRHVEVQVFADRHGSVIHLGERECSLQRRHQKIVEEAPSPLLDETTRHRIGRSAVAVAAACGYEGAGTVEFIVSADHPDEWFFMEMNTRLQVEHPVTELVTGTDLVAWQLAVAAGDPLPLTQDQVGHHGHAIEARIYAEDPARRFLPATGPVLALVEPARPHVRVDSGLQVGSEVGTSYDPMLAKVIAWGADRSEALARLDGALAATTVLGVTTNIGFLRGLLADPDVAAGRLGTELVERVADRVVATAPPRHDALVAAAMTLALDLEPDVVVDPWDMSGGWRPGAHAPLRLTLTDATGPTAVSVTGSAADATVHVDATSVRASAQRVDGGVAVTVAGVRARWATAGKGSGLWMGRDGHTWRFDTGADAVAAAAGTLTGGPVASPMPGTVLAVQVAAGDDVRAGQTLVVVEAMKMEHTVTTPVDGTVGELRVEVGQTVALDEILAIIDQSEEGSQP